MCVSTYRAYEGAVLSVVHMGGKRNKFYLAASEFDSVILADDFYDHRCMCECVCVSVCVIMCVRVCACVCVDMYIEKVRKGLKVGV